jgi:hypothetical protein
MTNPQLPSNCFRANFIRCADRTAPYHVLGRVNCSMSPSPTVAFTMSVIRLILDRLYRGG